MYFETYVENASKSNNRLFEPKLQTYENRTFDLLIENDLLIEKQTKKRDYQNHAEQNQRTDHLIARKSNHQVIVSSVDFEQLKLIFNNQSVITKLHIVGKQSRIASIQNIVIQMR